MSIPLLVREWPQLCLGQTSWERLSDFKFLQRWLDRRFCAQFTACRYISTSIIRNKIRINADAGDQSYYKVFLKGGSRFPYSRAMRYKGTTRGWKFEYLLASTSKYFTMRKAKVYRVIEGIKPNVTLRWSEWREEKNAPHQRKSYLQTMWSYALRRIGLLAL